MTAQPIVEYLDVLEVVLFHVFERAVLPMVDQLALERAEENLGMAEREGFEPSVEIFSLRRFSKPLPSATRPPLHWSQLYAGIPIICDAGR